MPAPMFAAALFTVTKTGKSLSVKCSSTDGRINVLYTHATECYSAIKKGVLPFVITWRKVESIMLSKINQR